MSLGGCSPYTSRDKKLQINLYKQSSTKHSTNNNKHITTYTNVHITYTYIRITKTPTHTHTHTLQNPHTHTHTHTHITKHTHTHTHTLQNNIEPPQYKLNKHDTRYTQIN